MRGLSRSRAFALSGLLATALLIPLLGPSASRAAVPRQFFGVAPQEPLKPADFARMKGVVGTLRVAVSWPEIEPSPGLYEWDRLDATIGGAAAAGIRVLPCVTGTPAWLSADWAVPPLTSSGARRAWSAFLALLVDRYGPRGAFWDEEELALPIRRWQVWNEPNFALFWHPRPNPAAYARLLKISATAIRVADPGALVVAAGVAPVGAGIRPDRFMRRLYGVPGARRAFDVAALHPYAVSLVSFDFYIRALRRVMARAGDRAKPLMITEVGVASDAVFPTRYDKGLLGQAEFLQGAYRLLLANRRRWRISGADWFTWKDAPAWDRSCSFCQYAGLFDRHDQPKPAWSVFRRIVTGSVR